MNWRNSLLVAAAEMLIVGGLAAEARAQAAAGPNQFRGTIDCERCHTKLTDQDRDTGVLDRVQLDEAATWRNKDRHSKAYANLRSPLGQNIGKLLNADVLDAATGCIQCHATSVDHSRWERANVNFSDEGVGCEACHGPSSNWEELHRQFPDWSKTPAAEKSALGWIDVRSPTVRAELCVSCHIGSDDYHREITHAMFAAGHPPLAGFEIESFANKMPRHWRYPYEKTSKPSFDRTRDLLVASVVALRMSAELAIADVREQRWPELARFDCFACHHELAEPQWPLVRDATGTPGRPELIVGCLPLVRVAAQVVAGPSADKKLDVLIEKLQAPFQSATFGDPQVLANDGPTIIRGCNSLEGSLDATRFTPQLAMAVLHDVAREATSEARDFDTARQLFGAWCVVYEELVANKSLRLSPQNQQQLSRLLAGAEAHDRFVLERGRPGKSGTKEPEDQSVTGRLQELFDNRADFDPIKFANGMSKLDDLIRQ